MHKYTHLPLLPSGAVSTPLKPARALALGSHNLPSCSHAEIPNLPGCSHTSLICHPSAQRYTHACTQGSFHTKQSKLDSMAVLWSGFDKQLLGILREE